MQQQLNKFISYLKCQYNLDLRALALMRVGTGIILIIDLIIRANSIAAHYTDAGVLPVEAMKAFYWHPYYFSFHALSSNLIYQSLLFILAFFFAIFLTIGYKTKLFTFLSLVMLVSIQNRNGLLLQGGDDLFRLVIFWGVFLPWNQRYSIDSIKQGLPPETTRLDSNFFVGVPALGYALLIFSVYFFSAFLKDSPEWTTEGSALYYALSIDQMILPLGKKIYYYPELLKVLTHIAYYIELIAPFLLFIPFLNPFFRTMGILAILSLHIGISLTLFVGLFFLVGIVSALGLLPVPVMDKIERKLSPFIAYVKKKLLHILHFTPSKSNIIAFRKFTRENFYYKLSRNCFLFFVILFSLIWNVSNIPGTPITVSENFKSFGNALRLEQNWNMFSPTVLKDDGWYILEGTTADSLTIDINRGGKAVDYQKPANMLDYVDNDRWRKFGENYMFISNDPIRIHYCKYLFKEWNNEHPDKKLVRLKVIFMMETTKPDYQYVLPKKLIFCTCP